MKKPCEHCPYRKDVTPFLHPKRAEELAYLAQNERISFSCHKTTEYDEDSENMVVTSGSKECAGMLTLRAQDGYFTPKNFEPSWDLVYTYPEEMISAYQEQWGKRFETTCGNKIFEK